MERSDFVTLKDGVIASITALRLGWALEARGYHLSPTDDNRLRVQPHETLTDEDIAAIKANRDELLKLVIYSVQVVA